MSKKSKGAIIITIVIVFITFNMVLSNNEYKKYLINTDIKFINQSINNKENFALLIGKDGCPACDKIFPKLKDYVVDEKEIVYYYEINDENRDTDLDNLMSLFPEMEFVPYISYIKNGTEVKNIILEDNEECFNEFINGFKLIKDDF